MATAAKGVVCTTVGHQHPGRELPTKLDGEGRQRCCLRRRQPPTIPAGSPPPKFMATAAKEVICAAVGMQHPIRDPAAKLGGEGRQTRCLRRPRPAASPQGSRRQNWRPGPRKTLSAPPLTSSCSAGSPPPNLMTRAAKGVVGAPVGLQHLRRKPAPKIDDKGRQRRCLCRRWRAASPQRACRQT